MKENELIERLKQLLEHLQADWGHDHHFKTVSAAITALQTPAVSNADEADRKRLDWLETKGKFFNPRRHIEGYESITRDAIDAAMEATK